MRTFSWIYWINIVKEYLNKLLVYWYNKIWRSRGKCLAEYVSVLDHSPSNSATCTSAMFLTVWFDNFRSYVVNCGQKHWIHANTCIVKERLQNNRPTNYLTWNKTAPTVVFHLLNLSEWNECPPQSMSSDQCAYRTSYSGASAVPHSHSRCQVTSVLIYTCRMRYTSAPTVLHSWPQLFERWIALSTG